MIINLRHHSNFNDLFVSIYYSFSIYSFIMTFNHKYSDTILEFKKLIYF